MFEIELNNAFEIELFNCSTVNRENGYRFHCTAVEDNVYTQYLKNTTISSSTPGFVLEAIAYNSSSNAHCWRMEPYTYSYYDERMKQRLAQPICTKIRKYLDAKPEFKQRVERILQDYHILLDVNDNAVSVSDYPDVWFGIGYFETFPISYFDIPISEDEVKDIAKAVNDRFIIVNTNELTVVYHIDINHHVSNHEFELVDSISVINIIIYMLANGDEERYTELTNKRKNMTFETLHRMVVHL